MHQLQNDRRLQIYLGLFVALIAIIITGWIYGPRSSAPAFRKLPIALKLTQDRAIELSIDQMNGTAPLQIVDVDAADRNAPRFEPPRMMDIMMSMREDSQQRKYDGVCAMSYNIPVSVCYMQRLGGESDLLMYNLRMIGFSESTTIATESSMLCDRGVTGYGQERFKFVWIEFYDIHLERNFLRVEGRLGRVVQAMAWLNRGVTVCDEWSAQKQANALFQISDFERIKL